MGAILAGFPRLDWLDDDKAALFPGLLPLSLKGAGLVGQFCMSLKAKHCGTAFALFCASYRNLSSFS